MPFVRGSSDEGERRQRDFLSPASSKTGQEQSPLFKAAIERGLGRGWQFVNLIDEYAITGIGKHHQGVK